MPHTKLPNSLKGAPAAWTPFRLATGARWCRTPDLHRDWPRSERGASAVGLVRRMWLPRIDSHDDDLGQSQAGCFTSRGNKMEPATGTAPASSALQKRRDYLSIHAGKKWRKPEGMLPMRLSAHDLFSKRSRHACPVQLPMKMVGRHGAAPCSAV
jgi:hypothetical protein